jgi:hypothetical protein
MCYVFSITWNDILREHTVCESKRILPAEELLQLFG